MPLILGTNSIKDTGYEVANSCRFDMGSATEMEKTLVAGNRKTWTLSAWVKRNVLGLGANLYQRIYDGSITNQQFSVMFENTDQIKVYNYHAVSPYQLEYLFLTTQLFRDTSAWYHIVVALDTTQSTESNRFKLYVNGTRVTDFATDDYPDEDEDNGFMNHADQVLTIGRQAGSSYYTGHQLAELVGIDGLALAPTSFGEFNEDSPTIWQPIDVSGLTFGNNGFYLDFEASDNLGNDANGGTDFSETNLAATDQASDSPTNNFCTMNPLNPFQYNFTFAEGNLTLANTDNNWNGASGTIAIKKGKWFFEAKYTGSSNLQHFYVGFTGIEAQNASDATRNSVAFYNNDGGEVSVSDVSNNASTTADYGTFAQNDIIGVALDYDNELISFYKNGSAIVTDFDFGATTYPSGLTDGKLLSPYIGHYASSDIALNFGNPPYANSSSVADANGYGAFEYAVPSGYFALCTKNLAEYG